MSFIRVFHYLHAAKRQETLKMSKHVKKRSPLYTEFSPFQIDLTENHWHTIVLKERRSNCSNYLFK